ncbi:metallophosphoesterase [Oceanicella sp. SM1341]|uniref:metallophosphoesterase n=1 Tax=Oceanicella sp. SM1341 TaxID=1548889 RepID=UPI000E4E1723|nr:metallophosphoesterase [Oceanicella sp. SM1341]
MRFFRRSPPPPPPARPRVAADRRVYAVGDVHGRSDLLIRLLETILADHTARSTAEEAAGRPARRLQLVLLGDYVDRGDQSREVLDMLASLRAETRDDGLVLLRGNHEAALLEFLDDPSGGAAWLSFGGRQTLGSYGITLGMRPGGAELDAAAAALREALGARLGLLRTTVMLHRSGDVVFAHAGIAPGLPLSAQPEQALLWGRSRFLEEGPPEGLVVVHGHYDAPEPVIAPGRICVDTGAYYTGRLTALRLDAEQGFVHVDAGGAP